MLLANIIKIEPKCMQCACVCVCVCVRARARARACACMRMYVCMCMYAYMYVCVWRNVICEDAWCSCHPSIEYTKSISILRSHT